MQPVEIGRMKKKEALAYQARASTIHQERCYENIALFNMQKIIFTTNTPSGICKPLHERGIEEHQRVVRGGGDAIRKGGSGQVISFG